MSDQSNCDDIAPFYAAHAAGGPGNVVLARAQRKDGGERVGVFSTLARATAWSDGLSDEEYHGTVFVPYVVDVPEYGNVPKGERQ